MNQNLICPPPRQTTPEIYKKGIVLEIRNLNMPIAKSLYVWGGLNVRKKISEMLKLLNDFRTNQLFDFSTIQLIDFSTNQLFDLSK